MCGSPSQVQQHHRGPQLRTSGALAGARCAVKPRRTTVIPQSHGAHELCPVRVQARSEVSTCLLKSKPSQQPQPADRSLGGQTSSSKMPSNLSSRGLRVWCSAGFSSRVPRLNCRKNPSVEPRTDSRPYPLPWSCQVRHGSWELAGAKPLTLLAF